MEIRLISLKYENFKNGSETLIFNGLNTDILGTNRAGKTRAADAWEWLFTDKDSAGSNQFEIKPVSGLKKKANVVVESTIMLGSIKKVLRKELSESWTTKRGKATTEFTGHNTEYFIDGAPVGLKGFDAFCGKIIDKTYLPCLTGLSFFNERLDSVPTEGKKKKLSNQEAKRLLLLTIAGDVSDHDVVKLDPAFGRIEAMLAGKTSEAYRLELDYQKKIIKKEKDDIEPGIKELAKQLPDGNPVAETGKMMAEKAELESRLSVLRNELSMIESGGAVGIKKKELLDVQNQIQQCELSAAKLVEKEAARLRSVSAYCIESLRDAHKKMETIDRELNGPNRVRALLGAAEAKIISLRAEWYEENKKAFVPPEEVSCSCPVCGALPEHQVNFSAEKAEADFNLKKAEALKSINTAGRSLADQTTTMKTQKLKLQNDLEDAKKLIEASKKDLEKADKDVAEPVKPVVTPEHAALIEQAQRIDAELGELAIGGHDAAAEVYAQIGTVEASIDTINKAVAEIEAADKIRARINELGEQEKTLSASLERMEADIQLMENFIRAKCKLLTDKINSKFKITRWLLFKNQINGGLEDCCVAMGQNNEGQWVPYGSLNTEGRYNVNIDCVNTLSAHFDVIMPIWLDDVNLVVETLPTAGQMIRLVVSAADEKLRVVCHEAGQKAA